LYGTLHFKNTGTDHTHIKKIQARLDEGSDGTKLYYSNGARNILLRYLTLSKKAPVSSETLALGLGPWMISFCRTVMEWMFLGIPRY
jgi:hypothetical protein